MSKFAFMTCNPSTETCFSSPKPTLRLTRPPWHHRLWPVEFYKIHCSRIANEYRDFPRATIKDQHCRKTSINERSRELNDANPPWPTVFKEPVMFRGSVNRPKECHHPNKNMTILAVGFAFVVVLTLLHCPSPYLGFDPFHLSWPLSLPLS